MARKATTKKASARRTSKAAAKKPAAKVSKKPTRKPTKKSAKQSVKTPVRTGERRAAASPSKPKPKSGRKSVGATSSDPNREPLFRASLAVSLDGYIADVSGSVDWLNTYFSPEIDFAGFLRTIGATVYGRTTYDWALAQGFTGAADPAAPGGRPIVLTRRPIENRPEGVETFSGDVRELAARLRQELRGTGRDVWLMGGGISIASFHEAGLVDRWELTIIPILLGNGVPLFPPHSRGFDSVRLVRSRALEAGLLEAWFEPARA